MFNTLGGPLRYRLFKLREADCVLVDILMVYLPCLDHEIDDTIEERYIRTNARSKMDVGLLGSRRCAWINYYQLRPVWPRQPIKNPRPKHGLGRSYVVSHMKDRVRQVNIPVRARLAVAAEALNHGS